MAPCLLGRVATVYFAVGSRSLQKASRSAASSKRFDGLRAMLAGRLTRQGKLRLQAEHPFDIVAVDAGASHAAEFEATRPVADRSSLSTAERQGTAGTRRIWRRGGSAPPRSAPSRRRCNTRRGVADGRRHVRVLDLLEAACAVSEGPVVAFVPWTAAASTRRACSRGASGGACPGMPRRGEHGRRGLRNATASRALVDAWLAPTATSPTRRLPHGPAGVPRGSTRRARAAARRRASTAGATPDAPRGRRRCPYAAPATTPTRRPTAPSRRGCGAARGAPSCTHTTSRSPANFSCVLVFFGLLLVPAPPLLGAAPRPPRRAGTRSGRRAARPRGAPARGRA